MPPKGNLEMPVVVVAEEGAAPHPPGTALASKAGSGATDDTASAQLGGTDKVPSEAAWPTLADAPEPRPATGPTLPKPLAAPPSAPVIEPRPSKSRLRPNASRPRLAEFPLRADVRLVANPDRTSAPVPAPLLAPLPVAPVRLDRALIGAEAAEDPSEAPVPIAAGDRPAADDDPGVARSCRAWGVAEMNRAVVARASPPGFVVRGGDANVVNPAAAAEL